MPSLIAPNSTPGSYTAHKPIHDQVPRPRPDTDDRPSFQSAYNKLFTAVGCVTTLRPRCPNAKAWNTVSTRPARMIRINLRRCIDFLNAIRLGGFPFSSSISPRRPHGANAQSLPPIVTSNRALQNVPSSQGPGYSPHPTSPHPKPARQVVQL